MEIVGYVFVYTVAFTGVVGIMVVAAILRGWALSILWGWFAMPVFGLPALGIAQAMGVALTIGILTHQYVPNKDKETWQPFATMLCAPFLGLLIGWIIKGYM